MDQLTWPDNVPAHKRILAIAKINDLKYELLDHVQYSPDLIPFDFWQFLKKITLGKYRVIMKQPPTPL